MQTNSITTDFWRSPGANTFLYYSFDNQTLNDDSWNNRNWSRYSGSWSFTTWIKWYWVNNWNRWLKIPSFISWDFTLSLRINPTNNWLSIQTLFWTVEWWSSGWYLHFHMYNSQYSQLSIALSWDSWTFAASEWITRNSRNHIVLTKSWNTFKIYKNKNLILTRDFSTQLSANATRLIWNWYNNDRHVSGVFDEVIIETKARTQEEITKYYDKIIW